MPRRSAWSSRIKVLGSQGQLEQAQDYLETALAICQRENFHVGTGWCFQILGEFAYVQGQFARSRQHLDNAIKAHRAANLQLYLSEHFCLSGDAALANDDSDSFQLFSEAIAIAREVNQPHFVADFATTTAANGKLEILQRKNADTPHGWVQNAAGNPSTNANELKQGGALLPLGGDREHGSHKGYALGSIVDIFSAVLSGASYGPWAPPFPAYVPMPVNMPGEGLGHFFGAMRIDAFRPAEEFKSHMDNWISRFHEAKPVDENQKVLVPGDPEREMEAVRMKEGIPVVESVLEDLKKVGERFGISLEA